MQPDTAPPVSRLDLQREVQAAKLIEGDPSLRMYFDGGIRAALEQTVPRIVDGRLGGTEEEMNLSVSTIASDGAEGLRKAGGTEDECFVFRVGFLQACRPAQQTLLVALAAINRATDAAVLLTAGLEAAAEAMDLAAKAMPQVPVAQPAPHALGLGAKRPLRPEDFGALPTSRPSARI